MNVEQAYIEGFVKKASEYGLSCTEANELLKSAVDMPEGLKKNLMKLLKDKKLQTDMKQRLAVGGVGGAYLGLLGGNAGEEREDKSVANSLKGALIGGGLGLAAGGISGAVHKRKLLNNYMKDKIIPRFEELVAKDPKAPLNRLSNLIQAETKHNTSDLQKYVTKNNLFSRPRLDSDLGDDWKDSY